MTRTILLVDDSPVTREVVKIHLDGLGYEFVEARDAQSALALADSRVDLVISDFNMPGMNGIAFVERLRAHNDSAVRRVPVILLTGDSKRDLSDRSKAAGATAFLRKPVSCAGLRSMVQKLATTT